MAPRVGLEGAENVTSTGIRLPDRPAHSESLYRLPYPGPQKVTNVHVEPRDYEW